MKIFDYTDGKKGKLLANTGIANSMDGWLVRKGDKVFRVKLAKKSPRGTSWEWQSGAQFRNGKEIRPEDFGVEAICFCTGEAKFSGVTCWMWHVIGTQEWNREACKNGILKSEFSHISTDKDRARVAADEIAAIYPGNATKAIVDEYAERFGTTYDLIVEALKELEAV